MASKNDADDNGRTKKIETEMQANGCVQMCMKQFSRFGFLMH